MKCGLYTSLINIVLFKTIKHNTPNPHRQHDLWTSWNDTCPQQQRNTSGQYGQTQPLQYYRNNIPQQSTTQTSYGIKAAHSQTPSPGHNKGVSLNRSLSFTESDMGIRHFTPVPISALNPYINHWVIRARVTYKSEMKHWSNARGEGNLFSINLLDAKNSEIRFELQR